MTTFTKPIEAKRVACEICLKEVPESEAMAPAATGYVAYFCGPDCYETWKSRLGSPENRATPAKRPPPAAPPVEPEIQLGRDRGKAKDDLLKQLVKQHPQRDEPLIDSVEPDETPAP